MHIANPIYDVVFKYLLEDNKLAKLLLSTILGENIIELTFSPQEHIAEMEYASTNVQRQLTVYRIDFAATIKNKKGVIRQVLIEIQKAKLSTDIMRFRRYLGSQYRNPNNVSIIKEKDKKDKKQAIPLLTVYFLGHPLEYIQAPIVHVRRESWDVATGDKIDKKEPFIESLTHDSYVIQIPYLRPPRRTELEEMLQIFDQTKIRGDKHLLEIHESEVPERYRPILRRLQRAVADPDIIETMDVEDDILEELQKRERDAEYERAEKEKERAEKEKERAEKEKERAEKEKERTEKEQALEREQQERMEKEQALAREKQLLVLLKEAGIKP